MVRREGSDGRGAGSAASGGASGRAGSAVGSAVGSAAGSALLFTCVLILDRGARRPEARSIDHTANVGFE